MASPPTENYITCQQSTQIWRPEANKQQESATRIHVPEIQETSSRNQKHTLDANS